MARPRSAPPAGHPRRDAGGTARTASAVVGEGDRASSISRLLLPLLVIAWFALVYAASLGGGRMFMWDEAEYASLGRSLLHGHGLTTGGSPDALRPPLLPLALAAGMAVAPGAGDSGPRTVVLVMALLGLIATYAMTKRASDSNTALAAVVLLGSMPLYRAHATLVLTEIPFMALFAAAIWQLAAGLEGRPRAYLWSAGCLALALLTRYTALLFVPIALALVLLTAARTGVGALARHTVKTREFWLAPLVALVIGVPWIVRERLQFGNPLVGFMLAQRLIPKWASMPWHYYFTTLPDSISWPALSLCAIAIVVAVHRRIAPAAVSAIAMVVIVGWHSHYAYKEPRLISAALPFLAVLGAIGLMRGVAPLLARFIPPKLAPALALLLLVPIALLNLPRAMSDRTSVLGYPSLIEACDQLRTLGADRGRIVGASRPQLEWYAGASVLPFPKQRVDLPVPLAAGDWVVIVNYERDQPDYVTPLLKRLRPEDAARGDVMRFRSGLYQTVLVRSRLLLDRVLEEPTYPAGP